MSIRRGRLAGALTNVSLVCAALGQVNPPDLVTAEVGAIDLMRQTAASQASPTAAQAPTVVTDNIVLRGTIKRDFVVPDRASNSEHGTNTSADAKFQCQDPCTCQGLTAFLQCFRDNDPFANLLQYCNDFANQCNSLQIECTGSSSSIQYRCSSGYAPGPGPDGCDGMQVPIFGCMPTWLVIVAIIMIISCLCGGAGCARRGRD